MSVRNSVQLSSDVQLSKFATDCFWTSSWRAFASSSAADGATPMPFFVIQNALSDPFLFSSLLLFM